MNAIFVTGTDTGVGKTVVAGLLAKHLLKEGCNVITQKWIQTGSKGFPEDIDTHLKLMGKKRCDIKDYIAHMCPYNLKFPSSPHLSARLEKKQINANKIKKSFKFLQKRFDFVIVEGVGGALVPYNNKKLVIDIAKELKIPALVVVGNKLGAINHTLLTIEAIKRRKIKIAGIIYNNIDKNTHRNILEDNCKFLRAALSKPLPE